MRESKFIELAKYFESSKESHITLSFEEIEKIIGQKLYPSAYKYAPYWHPSRTHVITNTWIDVGYELDVVDLVNQRVSFTKVVSV